IYPWQGALKKYTGTPYRQFVQDAFAYYHQQWKAEQKPAVEWITKVQNNNVINYQYPYRAANNAVIVQKNSYRKVPAFYRINEDGREQKIATQSITTDDYFSYNNNSIIYAAYQPHIRWG